MIGVNWLLIAKEAITGSWNRNLEVILDDLVDVAGVEVEHELVAGFWRDRQLEKLHHGQGNRAHHEDALLMLDSWLWRRRIGHCFT